MYLRDLWHLWYVQVPYRMIISPIQMELCIYDVPTFSRLSHTYRRGKSHSPRVTANILLLSKTLLTELYLRRSGVSLQANNSWCLLHRPLHTLACLLWVSEWHRVIFMFNLYRFNFENVGIRAFIRVRASKAKSSLQHHDLLNLVITASSTHPVSSFFTD